MKRHVLEQAIREETTKAPSLQGVLGDIKERDSSGSVEPPTMTRNFSAGPGMGFPRAMHRSKGGLRSSFKARREARSAAKKKSNGPCTGRGVSVPGPMAGLKKQGQTSSGTATGG